MAPYLLTGMTILATSDDETVRLEPVEGTNGA
jgi:hypothetical protein